MVTVLSSARTGKFVLFSYMGNVAVGFDLATADVVTAPEFICSAVTDLNSFTDEELRMLATIIPAHKVITKGTLAITAKARSGKDYAADWLGNYFSGVIISPLAEPIYEMSRVLMGNRSGKNRETLIMIGQGLREQDPHVWVKAWLRKAISVATHNPSVKHFICQDLRQPNEYAFFSGLGATILRVSVDEKARLAKIKETDGESALNTKLLNDETESHTDKFEVDYVIKNDYDKNNYEAAISTFAKEVLVAQKGW